VSVTVPAVNPVRVVLVDDAEDVRFMVRMRLEREADFVVVGEAADGERGVQVVAEHHPHLVLLDVTMPKMDGLAALPLIRRESPGSIVVMLSALAEDSDVALRCRALGAAGYVDKGVPINVLLEQLRTLLKREFGTDAR
jgi:DNA-binding NarL/FixJ family response regulator